MSNGSVDRATVLLLIVQLSRKCGHGQTRQIPSNQNRSMKGKKRSRGRNLHTWMASIQRPVHRYTAEWITVDRFSREETDAEVNRGAAGSEVDIEVPSADEGEDAHVAGGDGLPGWGGRRRPVPLLLRPPPARRRRPGSWRDISSGPGSRLRMPPA
nr:hypothetical protein CFP56_54890 [Quercus suber]